MSFMGLVGTILSAGFLGFFGYDSAARLWAFFDAFCLKHHPLSAFVKESFQGGDRLKNTAGFAYALALGDILAGYVVYRSCVFLELGLVYLVPLALLWIINFILDLLVHILPRTLLSKR